MMIASFASLKPITSPEQVKEASRLALADNHIVFSPSHVIEKGGRIIGHFEINTLPVIMAHLPNGLPPRESFMLMNTAECILAQQRRMVVYPVAANSPFHSLMPRLGFQSVATVDLFYKPL